MMTRSLIVPILLAAQLAALAASPPKGFTIESSEPSPMGTVLIERYANRTDVDVSNHFQLWLSDPRHTAKRALLYEYDRSAWAIASPDDSYIVVNDQRGSGETLPVLFKRAASVSYSLTTNDISSVVWSAIAIQYEIVAPFDHSYCEAPCWLGPRALLIHAWGHYSGEYSLSDWFAIYNVETGKLSFDLKSVNAADVKRLRKSGQHRRP